MIVLAGADLVLPDRVVPGGSLVIHDGRIEAIEPRVIDAPAGANRRAGFVVGCAGMTDRHAMSGRDEVADQIHSTRQFGRERNDPDVFARAHDHRKNLIAGEFPF